MLHGNDVMTSNKLWVAYGLWLVFGFFGIHHMYLNRWGHCALYLSLWITVPQTFPYAIYLIVLAVYWIIDAFRMPLLVAKCNNDFSNSKLSKYSRYNYLFDIYQMWLPPCCFAGYHHFYVGNYFVGFVYLFTFGGFGIGWIIDAVYFIPFYYFSYYNYRGNNNSYNNNNKKKSLFIAYLTWLPCCGWLGLHQFYIGDYGLGIIYGLTFGFFGIGWLLDALFIKMFLFNDYTDTNVSGISTTRNSDQDNYTDHEHAATIGDVRDDKGKPSLKRCLNICCCNVGLRGKYIYYSHRYKTMIYSYLTWFLSCGILGFHHLYLQNYWKFLAHWVTLGGLGFAWIYDGLPSVMSKRIEHSNRLIDRIRQMKKSNGNDDDKLFKKCDCYTAYMLWLPPFGLTGIYDMYLGNVCMGWLRLCTLNFCGIGWIYDGIVMKRKVDKYNDDHGCI